MPLAKGHKQNFDTLRRAMLAGDAALMECQLVATGEPVAVICAANRLEDGEIAFVALRHAVFRQPVPGRQSAESGRWVLLARRSPRPTVLTGPSPRSTRTTMSEHLSAEIWIGGNIPETLVPDLCAAITDEGVALEWGEGSFAPKTVQDLKTSLRENDTARPACSGCATTRPPGASSRTWSGFCTSTGFPSPVAQQEMPRMTRRLWNTAPKPSGEITLAANVAGQPTVVAAELNPVEHLLDAAIKLAELDTDANFLSLVQTALKLLREQLPRPLPPLEPFSIEPTCGSKGGDE